MTAYRYVFGLLLLALALLRLLFPAWFERRDVEWLRERFERDDKADMSAARWMTCAHVAVLTAAGAYILASA